MYRKCVACVFALILLLSSCIFTGAYAKDAAYYDDDMEEAPNEICMDVSVCWHELYHSQEDVKLASDVALKGRVIKEESELRHNVVFTNVYVYVDSVLFGDIEAGDVIKILQTGGSIGKFSTPAPIEAPIMELGGQYELYLKETSPDEMYGQYYLITGGFQGMKRIFDNEDEIDTLPNTESTLTDSHMDDIAVRGWTPTMGHYWDKSNLNIYMDTNIAAGYSFSVYAAICSGVDAWHTYTNAPSNTYVTSTTNSDIDIYMFYYGNTGWDGLTSTTYSGSINAHSVIQINASYLYSGYSALSDLWKAIACHEFGHSLGLNHNTSVSQSIMRSQTVQYYNYNPGGTPKWSTPQSADIYSINSIY